MVICIQGITSFYEAAAVKVDKPEEYPIEAAFEKSFAAPARTPASPESHDHLGLDDAFDRAFPNLHASDTDKTSASDTASEYVDDSDESKESRPGLVPSPLGSANISGVDSDNADDAEGVDTGVRRRVRRMRQSDSFKRDEKKRYVGSKIPGTITSWSGNDSSSCRLHARCRRRPKSGAPMRSSRAGCWER